MYFWSTGFLVQFFSGASSVQGFGVDRFNDQSGSDNIDLHTAHGVSNFFRSTIGIKQGCTLPPTLFGIYIESWTPLCEHLHDVPLGDPQ